MTFQLINLKSPLGVVRGLELNKECYKVDWVGVIPVLALVLFVFSLTCSFPACVSVGVAAAAAEWRTCSLSTHPLVHYPGPSTTTVPDYSVTSGDYIVPEVPRISLTHSMFLCSCSSTNAHFVGLPCRKPQHFSALFPAS